MAVTRREGKQLGRWLWRTENVNTAKIRSLSATVSVSIVNRFDFGIYENIF
jgi:hypothetical protein